MGEFLQEFTSVVRKAGVAADTILYVVDDLSTDDSVRILEEYGAQPDSAALEVIRMPTNFGNQGALFYGLNRLNVDADDFVITLDCDGEDDVCQIPSIIKLGQENPEKLVLIERGRRQESSKFKVAFFCYKLLFRYLTRQNVIPNNFLLIPGRYVPFIQRNPLAAVHFAYAILKNRFPSVATERDRRSRYGGHSSQNLFMVASHGLVGLMVFYETVIAKLLLLLAALGLLSLVVVGVAVVVPNDLVAQRTLLWVSLVIAGMGAGFFSLMLASALALIFKMVVFSLSQVGVEQLATPTLPLSNGIAAPDIAPNERPGSHAS